MSSDEGRNIFSTYVKNTHRPTSDRLESSRGDAGLRVCAHFQPFCGSTINHCTETLSTINHFSLSKPGQVVCIMYEAKSGHLGPTALRRRNKGHKTKNVIKAARNIPGKIGGRDIISAVVLLTTGCMILTRC